MEGKEGRGEGQGRGAMERGRGEGPCRGAREWGDGEVDDEEVGEVCAGCSCVQSAVR